MSIRTTFETGSIPVETNYQSIVEHAIEGIFQTTLDGRYLLANPALAAMYGYGSVDELKSSLRRSPGSFMWTRIDARSSSG